MNPTVRQTDIDEELQTNFQLFVYRAFMTLHHGQKPKWNWHIAAMAYALLTVVGRAAGRLLITIPPRHLKSITVLAYIAWRMGNDPTLKVLAATLGRMLRASCSAWATSTD